MLLYRRCFVSSSTMFCSHVVLGRSLLLISPESRSNRSSGQWFLWLWHSVNRRLLTAHLSTMMRNILVLFTDDIHRPSSAISCSSGTFSSSYFSKDPTPTGVPASGSSDGDILSTADSSPLIRQQCCGIFSFCLETISCLPDDTGLPLLFLFCS